jgi:hypothetical protein
MGNLATYPKWREKPALCLSGALCHATDAHLALCTGSLLPNFAL